MEKMRTAEEMLAYFEANGTGCGGKREENLASFKIIEKHLEPDEYAVFTFIILYYAFDFETDGYLANAVTNKRMLMAQEGTDSVFKQIPRDEFRSMTMSWGKHFASLILDAEKMQLRMTVTVNEARKIQEPLRDVLKELGFDAHSPGPSSQDSFQIEQSEGDEAISLETSKDMVQFCEANNTLYGLRKKKAEAHFEIIAECLEEGERVIAPFVAGHYYEDSEPLIYFANAISDRRILMSCRGNFSGRLLKFISFDELEAVSVELEGEFAYILFEGRKMKVCMRASLPAGEQVRSIFADILKDPDNEEESTAESRRGMEDGRNGRTPGMRTAEEMLEFCDKNGLGGGLSKWWDLKHFRVIEECLAPDEYVLVCFIGLQNATGFAENDGFFAYALTNRRLIIAQQQMMGRSLRVVSHDELNDITANGDNAIIDSVKWEPNVEICCPAENLQRKLDEVMPKIRRKKEERVTGEVSNGGSTADKIRKYKGLLDEGAITEEEYQDIKRELLKQVTTER